mmetsp:Transcript_1865/g.4149  ORF Transcript_1865/g.4149 Transcript_1865/m.4149 type:complete len:297 (-) Transcript_1865:565-1455(-)
MWRRKAAVLRCPSKRPCFRETSLAGASVSWRPCEMRWAICAVGQRMDHHPRSGGSTTRLVAASLYGATASMQHVRPCSQPSWPSESGLMASPSPADKSWPSPQPPAHWLQQQRMHWGSALWATPCTRRLEPMAAQRQLRARSFRLHHTASSRCGIAVPPHRHRPALGTLSCRRPARASCGSGFRTFLVGLHSVPQASSQCPRAWTRSMPSSKPLRRAALFPSSPPRRAPRRRLPRRRLRQGPRQRPSPLKRRRPMRSSRRATISRPSLPTTPRSPPCRPLVTRRQRWPMPMRLRRS